MLGTLIKNNMKLMFRSKFMIVIMLLGPILITAVLSNVFSGLMSKYELCDHVQAGYSFQEATDKSFEETLKAAAQEAGITLTEFNTDNGEDALTSQSFEVFIIFDGNTYTIYKDNDHKIQADTVSYFLNTMFQNAAFSSVYASNSDRRLFSAPENSIHYQKHIIDHMPTPDSTDYYGIIEIVYFLWCGGIALSAVISSERKNHIETRFKLSMMSRISLFLGKAIPCILVLSAETAISAILCSLLFGIHWGNIIGSIFILFLSIIAATCMGIALFYIFNNTALPIICIFTLSWLFGFVGGTYETYMYSATPELIKKCSPIYYANRTLIEYSVIGSSNFTGPCIIFLAAFSIICGILGILLMKRRMEEK